MKKRIMLLAFLPLLVFAFAGGSQAWQGRMGGMGDPYGLMPDESDFLIHPAKIAKGEGIRFYGDYRFIYTGLLEMGFGLLEYDTTGDLDDAEGIKMSGDEYGHEALLGAAFPLGPGRMGLLFSYTGIRGVYDCTNYDPRDPPDEWEYGDAEETMDDFALRLLYGLPLDGLTLGGEIQVAYRQDEETNYWYDLEWPDAEINDIREVEEFNFGFPHDSRYWEALFKGSLEGMVGPLDLEFTLRGGFIFSGDNEWYYEYQDPRGTPIYWIDQDGTVEGWQVGGDLWVRYPVDVLVLPFLARVDYQEKTRDGDGVMAPIPVGFLDAYDYQHKTQSLQIEVGGGLDMELKVGSRVAAGIYYNYRMNKDMIKRTNIYEAPGFSFFDEEEDIAPYNTEHRVLLRLAGEHEFSPTIALRAGVNLFYGWALWEAEESGIYVSDGFSDTDDIEFSADGSHWGIGGSLGGSVRFQHFTLEPFFTVGYQDLSLDGDGTDGYNGTLDSIYEGKFDESSWYIGGGMSILVF